MSLEEPTRYAIRLTEQAIREVNAALADMAVWNATEEDPTPQESLRLAREWLIAYQEARASLSVFPTSHPLPPEHQLFQREDAATVWIIHLRHGSRRPIRRDEAREMCFRDK